MVWHGGRYCVPTQWEPPEGISLSQSIVVCAGTCLGQCVGVGQFDCLELGRPGSVLASCSTLGACSLGNVEHTGIA